MFASVTATGVITQAGLWTAQIYPIVLIAMGLGLTLILVNWAVAKFRGGRAAGGRKRKK